VLEEKYTCPWCGSRFENRIDLHIHAQTHYDDMKNVVACTRKISNLEPAILT